MAKDATFIVWHQLDDEEIQDICGVIENYLHSIGYREPKVDVTVTEDE